MSNGIKQGGTPSSKVFNIYISLLSMNLKEKYTGYCLKDKIITHLCNADDLDEFVN